jgi:hypothetical protein
MRDGFIKALPGIINDELFMIEYTSHTILDLEKLPIMDFRMYAESIYNVKKADADERQRILDAESGPKLQGFNGLPPGIPL